MADILSELLQGAKSYTQGLRVSLKSNLSEREIPVYTGQGSGAGLLSKLGIEYALIVRDPQGRIVTTYNTPPPVDPTRRALLWALLGGLLFVLVRGVAP